MTNQERNKSDGKYRRTSKARDGSAAKGADTGAGGADEAAVWAKIRTALFPSKTGKIPHAGIRTGEIIGHRAWWLTVRGGQRRLGSLAHEFVWEPCQVVEGDVDREVVPNVLGGVYAYRSPDTPDFTRIQQLAAMLYSSPLILGTVRMWGEVVIHTHGYRAQFARIHSIDSPSLGYELLAPSLIGDLRKIYGLE